jgi:hypothetical protein
VLSICSAHSGSYFRSTKEWGVADDGVKPAAVEDLREGKRPVQWLPRVGAARQVNIQPVAGLLKCLVPAVVAHEPVGEFGGSVEAGLGSPLAVPPSLGAGVGILRARRPGAACEGSSDDEIPNEVERPRPVLCVGGS